MDTVDSDAKRNGSWVFEWQEKPDGPWQRSRAFPARREAAMEAAILAFTMVALGKPAPSLRLSPLQ
jgi:hypothetical protein